jgi:hypothetical protein
MRVLATLVCLFMAAPQASADRARQARQAEWAAALQAAATPAQDPPRTDLPEPLRDALRRWTREDRDAAPGDEA